MPVLKGRKIAMFVGDDYEDLELQYPKYRMREVGAEVIIAGIEAGEKYVGKYGYPQVSDVAVRVLRAEDFDGLIVPGGWMPDKLRRFDEVLTFTKGFEEQEKMIASICHGAWINISADVVKGYQYTSTPGIKDDMINAGAVWEDSEVVVDRHHISSRRPDDLPAFCRAMIDYMVKQR
ncbi:Putative cysteine protease YraA [Poriferisphaera corsica]|uniref:Cysteine protease YraA n=1 Tax=Poriferisphaera corsica TaxID=2528020 RepID=A0A517YYA9_9BACT|nr:type 1 glutamine amidotransferase domain-containing protein [Poriferisphaera corsica]QDU35187.1 Putative cysteine protease YraA [Poriferisphaera corsica]